MAGKYLRYLIRIPTQIHGHYREEYEANRQLAIGRAAKSQGFVLDLLFKDGKSSHRIIFDARAGGPDGTECLQIGTTGGLRR